MLRARYLAPLEQTRGFGMTQQIEEFRLRNYRVPKSLVLHIAMCDNLHMATNLALDDN